MSDVADKTAPMRARSAWPWAGLLLAVTLVLGPRLGHDTFDARPDAALYVLTARSLAEGEGYTYLGEPFRVRPPGFSWMLAPLVRAYGTDFAVLDGFVRGWGVLLAVLLLAWLAPRLGGALAFAVALVVWANVGVQELSNQVMSDVPGLALALGVLLLERRRRGRAGDVAVGLGIGLAALVRSSNALLLPAVVAARLVRRGSGGSGWRARLGGAALVTAGAALAFGPWIVRNARLDPAPVPAESTYLHSYSTALLHEDPGDPRSPRLGVDGWLERVGERVPEVVAGVGSRLTEEAPRLPWLVLGVVPLAALLLAAWRRRAPDDLFAVGTLLVLAIYFAFRVRLVLPLYALGLAAVVEGLLVLGRRAGRPRAGAGGAWALLAVLLVADAGGPRGIEAMRAEARTLGSLAAHLDARYPGEPLAAPRGYFVQVFAERHRVHSLLPSYRREGPAGVQRVLRERELELCALDESSAGHAAVAAALGPAWGTVARFGPWALRARGGRGR